MNWDWRKEDWEEHVLPGWRPIVKHLVELCKIYDIPIDQVKEKFGGLRFYTGKPHYLVDAAITQAEKACDNICEICGEPGHIAGKRWLKCFCANHHKETEERILKGK